MRVFSSICRRSLVRALCVCISSAITIAIVGCGDDGLGKRYSVSGNVTYNGKPVDTASISFHPKVSQDPKAESRGATGIVKNGYYTLSTGGGDDGAFPGEYDVSISGRTPDMTQAEANRQKVGGSARQDDVAKAYREAKSSIPLKYEGAILKATVEAKSNKIDFELKD
jgi:hypothetical protein